MARLAGAAAALAAPPRSLSGWTVSSLLFAASVVPSLLPRTWQVQGVISGFALAIGYALGLLLGAVLARLARRAGWPWALGGRSGAPPAVGPRAAAQAALRIAARASVAAGPVTAVVALAVNQRWQVDVRQLMGEQPAGWHYPLAVTAAALLAAGLLLVLSRLARAIRRVYVRLIFRVAPPGWRRPLRIAAALLLTVLVIDIALADWTVGALRHASASADARIEGEVDAPQSRLRSGGPGSGIAWSDLGRMGRAFVGTGPTAEQIASFSGADAKSPIRVYVGLAAAETPRDRAQLAVAELDRTGAFEREILLLITPTGSGWVDEDALDPLEYLHNGDTAAVAVQYSYLPSWATMLGNQDRAEDAARALFDAVSARIEQMPDGARPRVLLYGQSLGAFGSQRLFASLDDLVARVDGVVWAGPPRASALWRQLVADRELGSPAWQPVYQSGRMVRFGSDGAALASAGPVWLAPRVAYLQNATDPVTWSTPHLLTSRPEWMDEPRGPGISARMPFVPVVTGLQIAVDLLQSMGAPPGYGHVFGAAHAEAWSMVAPPPGWSEHDTARLLAVLAADQLE